MVMSRVAGWAVSSFSLLSSRRLAESEARAKPKMVPGLLSPFCTRAVTSRVTYWPAVESVKVLVASPMEGAEVEVMVDSFHAELTGEREMEPGVLTRLTKTVSVARAIWLEMVPAGRLRSSNCRNAVLPLPT
jgi:Rieske Fe-S protein